MSMTVEMILRLIDQATGPIRGVESELERLQKTAAAIDKQRTTGGGVKASVWLEQQEAIRKVREEAERYDQTMRKINAAQSAAMSAAAAHGLERISTAAFRGGVRQGVAGEHSQVSLETQGNKLAQIEEIQQKAAQMSAVYKAFTKTQFETMIGAAKSYTGSLEHAFEAMDDLAQIRTIQLGQHGHSSDEAFNTITKSLETAGVAGDPKRIHDRLESYAKIMNVFKETLNEGSFAQFFNQVGPAASSLSERFLRGTAAHLMQEMGPGMAGTAVAMFQQEFQAGTATPKAMETLDKLGLLDEKLLRRKTSNNEIRWMDPHAIHGWKLALSDPDLWIDRYLAPALARLPGDDERLAAEMAMASNQNVRRLLNKVLHQKNVIEKDLEQVNAAPGLEAWKIWSGKDPSTAWAGLTSQTENLLRDAGKPFMGKAVKVMDWLSSLEAKLGKVTERHPDVTAAAGLGLVGAGWGLAGAAARWSLLKTGSLIGEGMAGAAAGSFLGMLARGASTTLFRATPYGILAAAATQATINPDRALEVWNDILRWKDHQLGGHAGEAASSVFERMRQMPSPIALPFFAQPAPAPAPLQPIGPPTPIPTFAALQGVPGGGSAPAGAPGPHVDMSEVEDAVRKAEEAGQQIKRSLDVKAEAHVDSSSVDVLLAKLREAVGLIGQINRGGNSRGHGLNDGAEAH